MYELALKTSCFIGHHNHLTWPFIEITNKSCSFQVSTSTGVISHFVNLQVVVPEAFILGSGELHVDMGSEINLVCIIEKVGCPLLFLSYLYPSSLYHNESFIWHGVTGYVYRSFNWVKGGIFVINKSETLPTDSLSNNLASGWQCEEKISFWQLDKGLATYMFVLCVCQINFRQVIFISFLWALISYCVHFSGSNDSTFWWVQRRRKKGMINNEV